MPHETERAKGAKAIPGIKGFSGGSVLEPPLGQPPTLADLGLSKKESALAQKIAALPAEEFEQIKAGATTVIKAAAISSPNWPRVLERPVRHQLARVVRKFAHADLSRSQRRDPYPINNPQRGGRRDRHPISPLNAGCTPLDTPRANLQSFARTRRVPHVSTARLRAHEAVHERQAANPPRATTGPLSEQRNPPTAPRQVSNASKPLDQV